MGLTPEDIFGCAMTRSFLFKPVQVITNLSEDIMEPAVNLKVLRVLWVRHSLQYLKLEYVSVLEIMFSKEWTRQEWLITDY